MTCDIGLSGFRLDIGDPHKRQKPDASVGENCKQKHYFGEHIIHCFYSAWRLDDLGSKLVVATSMHARCEREHIDRSLGRLVGQRVASVDVREPGLDFVVRFENHLALKIFPTAALPGRRDYLLWENGVGYVVCEYSRLIVK